MILTNRLFIRRPPSRDARSVYIFCEGVKREYQYFSYFKELDSRINIEIYPLSPNENNSPIGLFSIASKCLLKTEDNPNPKYELIKGDQVWIVLDTDLDEFESRQPQLVDLMEKCNELKWNIAQSNPCFEVWLYYHFFDKKPAFDGDTFCKGWKPLLDDIGGFDSRKHPIFVQTAIENAEVNFSKNDGLPVKGSTEVFMLSKSILPLFKEKIDKVLNEL